MIRDLIRALLAFEQPPMNYCARCAWWYPPSHWPCR